MVRFASNLMMRVTEWPFLDRFETAAAGSALAGEP